MQQAKRGCMHVQLGDVLIDKENLLVERCIHPRPNPQTMLQVALLLLLLPFFRSSAAALLSAPKSGKAKWTSYT